MTTVATIIVALLAAVGTGVGGVFAVRGKIVDRGPDWFDRLSKRVDELYERVEGLNTQVGDLQREVSGLQAWRSAALRYIRELLVLVEPERHPPVPNELQEDVAPPPRTR